MQPGSLDETVKDILSHAEEAGWLEFKQSNSDPQKIGENVSALSNTAALLNRPKAYILWGIDDNTKRPVGTTFRPREKRIGGQELENWLTTQLRPAIDVQIREGEIDGCYLVLFEIQAADHLPVRFRGTEYVRIGSYTKKLADHPEKERALWTLFNEVPFEDGVAVSGVTSDDVLSLIDYPAYFKLMGLPLPDNRTAIFDKLMSESVIRSEDNGRYAITNIGGILFGASLDRLGRLARKALRVVIYRGNNRVEASREQVGNLGYAVGFSGAIEWINGQLPQDEEIGQALRRNVRTYPEIAIRELVANALVHQDFTVTGAGPIVEVFTDRMEISNPGAPLVDPLRFIDEPPRSRNEKLAGMMRRVNICEERGSGIDKVVFAIEAFQLPAPDFRVAGNSTVATLFAQREFAGMDRSERVRACYQHACLMYVSGRRMSNSSLRKRLGLEQAKYTAASRIIRDAIADKLVKPHSGGSESRRNASYVPFWA